MDKKKLWQIEEKYCFLEIIVLNYTSSKGWYFYLKEEIMGEFDLNKVTKKLFSGGELSYFELEELYDRYIKAITATNDIYCIETERFSLFIHEMVYIKEILSEVIKERKLTITLHNNNSNDNIEKGC
jgi:hypothetical protein